ncbi:MAG: tripartite tricarboxylate transporter permease, partial [Alphaproteobacteria bacterium]
MDYILLMLSSAGDALIIMSDPMRLAFLFGGVIIGLILGVIPGLGGIVGMALLLPFTFDMDKFAAFAFLLGMGSVTTTSDTIPAVLFGVPGTTGSAATILDGHPMARKGEAGRAFGAAYTASMMGGLFGALLLAVSIPILRPVMLYLGSPELLSFSVFGLSMVAVLSGSSPMRGVAAACVGLLVAMVGSDPQTGTLRWTLDSLYLWDGLPIVPVTIGLFALPELADMAITRSSIATDSESAEIDTRSGQWQGVRDTFTHWWLVIRVAWLGAALGAIPGLGAAIVDWVAYGHAARTEPGAAETFGKGDVRGVLASEGANNAKEGGALVPTIAFGVPGSASMAILLGAFLIHGLIPGPDMLTKHLDVTYSMVWSVAIANILGAGLCFAFSNQFAKIALLRYTII